jgi:salicylate hydroxylase
MHNNLVNIYKDYIAIIGAGISGLTLGIVLKKQNIPCIIFEKFPSISEYGAGISISRNGQKVLKEIEILDKLKLISGNPKNAYFISNNKEITSFAIDHVTTSRKVLHSILLEKYLELNGEIKFDHQLINIDNQKKLLSFSNSENLYVDHIAACDGIKSICRNLLSKDKLDPVYSGYSVWRSIINEKQNDVRFYLGPNFHVVTYPVDDNKTSFVGAFKRLKSTEESWRTLGNYHELRSDIPGYILDKYPSIKHNKEIFKWGVYTRTDMGNMYMDNITFLGDAAHPIVPFMGQGGCLAIEDSYIFGKLLIKYRNDIKKSQSIYHDIRYSRVKKIRDDSLNQATFNHLKNPLLIYIRNLLMKYTNIIHILTKKVWDYDPKKEIANINNQ